jgi:SAM-dependent methyltransferase
MRPFYAEYAEAYDLLVADPVEPWAEAAHDRLLAGGWPSALVLDAGCGTGRHAAALAAKGHHVDLADASEQLLTQATSRNPSALALHADLCALAVSRRYQAATCRGVLNDMTTEANETPRCAAFAGRRQTAEYSCWTSASCRALVGGRTECPGTGRLTSGHAASAVH